MTVTSLGVRNEYTANAGQTVFNYTFLIFGTSDLNVYITSSGDTADDSTDITTAYTVTSGVGNPNGGTITLNSGATANDLITIVSNITNSRTTDYQSSGDFDEETVNDDFDRTLSLVKQQLDSTGRTLSFPQSLQNATQLTLPVPVSGQYVVWNAGATGLDNAGAPGSVLDSNLNGTTIQMVANASLNATDVIITTGYSVAGDGGDNTFLARAVTGASADGGALIKGVGNEAIEFVGLFPKQYRSVKQWGAVGDDSTDDTVAIVAAAAAMVNKSTLHFPSGVYYCEATIDLTARENITIYGDGLGTSIVKRTNGTFGDTILFSATDPTLSGSAGITAGCTLRDIQFFAEVEIIADSTVHLVNIQRFIYQSVYLRNYYKGLHVEGVRDSWFDNFEGTTLAATYFTSLKAGSAHIHLADNTGPQVNTETFFTNFNFTTAANNVTEDVEYSILVDCEMDGVWFANGHTFGGDTANLYVNAAGLASIGGLRLSNVYLDQFCNRNIIFTGAASVAFRNFTFNNCRIFGGLVNCITSNASSNMVDIVFTGGCEIGTNQGQGVQHAGGEISFLGCVFREMNQLITANGYAIQCTSSATKLIVMDCDMNLNNLTYGIWCNITTPEYHFQGNQFNSQDGNISEEILFSDTTLNGTCSGNITGRTASGDVAAAASTTLSNIAISDYNLTGATVSVANIFPTWHGRRVTIKADANTQNMVNTGNIRNKGNASPLAILVSDMTMYEFRADTARWHEV